jgi:hypothetical protein
VAPFKGSVTGAEVAVVVASLALYKSLEPGPVLPICNSYKVTP